MHFTHMRGFRVPFFAPPAPPDTSAGDGSASVYLFHRADGFYPLELRNDDEARANAECNPGTLKVENAITGAVVWPNNDSTSSGTPIRKASS